MARFVAPEDPIDASPPASPVSAPAAPGAAFGKSASIGLGGTVFQILAGWTFTLVYATFVTLASLVTLGRLSNYLVPVLLRGWSRTMLAILRVELVVEGYEHLRDRTMKIALFNHTSLLDAMIVTAVKPYGGVSAIKREVLFIPLVGVALWSMGFLLIDRGRTERAKRVLARAADRMARERLTVFIAPEGTRSADGRLRSFKKGAFHIARATRAPFVPMLIEGAADVMPKGQWVSNPGRIRVRFLPPIPTDDLTAENLGEACTRMHALFAAELGEPR